MEKSEAKTQSRTKYMWDATRLAWIEAPADEIARKQEEPAESTETPSLAARGEPVKGGRAETVDTSEVSYKGAMLRSVAMLVDFVILIVLHALLVVGIVGAESALALYITPIIVLLYFVGFWAWRGQTPGKILIGARVVKANGESIGIGRAFLRYVVFMSYFYAIMYTRGVIPVIMLIMAAVFLFTALNQRKRGVHDLVAGTVVVNTRPPKVVESECEETESEEGPAAQKAA
ncbi:MAG: RDD family protein [Dehalococcoidia bacterium]|nr:RDD family protein [Dehalococcoidia bacterium]